MRIKMVSKLRRHDAAIMELGLEYTDKMAIPPGVLAFPLSGYCIAECTQTVINDFLPLLQSRLLVFILSLSRSSPFCSHLYVFFLLCQWFSSVQMFWYHMVTFMSMSVNSHYIHCTGTTKIGHNCIRVTIAYPFAWCSHFNTAFT